MIIFMTMPFLRFSAESMFSEKEILNHSIWWTKKKQIYRHFSILIASKKSKNDYSESQRMRLVSSALAIIPFSSSP